MEIIMEIDIKGHSDAHRKEKFFIGSIMDKLPVTEHYDNRAWESMPKENVFHSIMINYGIRGLDNHASKLRDLQRYNLN